METIKKKILALHSDLAEAITSAASASDRSDELTTKAKELEIKQRDLMKTIANKVRNKIYVYYSGRARLIIGDFLP
jgi:hypothetical protein